MKEAKDWHLPIFKEESDSYLTVLGRPGPLEPKLSDVEIGEWRLSCKPHRLHNLKSFRSRKGLSKNVPEHMSQVTTFQK